MYGVILLPTDVEPFLRVSSAIARLAAPIMQLGADAPPHVSVVHTDISAEAAMDLWTDLTAHHRPDFTLRFSGLMFTPLALGYPYVPEGGVYYGLECAHSAPLLDLHEHARSWLASAQAPIINPSGVQYRPHVTLGILRTAPDGPIPLPNHLFEIDMQFRPALGRLGPYGTFPELLATA